LINIETTLKVAGFPIEYTPVLYPFFGIRSTISGVGYNVAKALTTLGEEVRFLSIIGQDAMEGPVRSAITTMGVPDDSIVTGLEETAQSIILFDPSGQRQINVDLKNIQDQVYPPDRFETALAGCGMAVLCNINFSRPFLQKAAEAGTLIATDVHTISDLDDPYNTEFMHHADILFMSDELLPLPPEAWAEEVMGRYTPGILVIGLGSRGAYLAVGPDGFRGAVPAVRTRPPVNSIGAGDALFSAFLYSYAHTRDPHRSLQQAVVFASYKIGETGAAEGFLDREGLAREFSKTQDQFHK
jgi:ribokinase